MVWLAGEHEGHDEARIHGLRRTSLHPRRRDLWTAAAVGAIGGQPKVASRGLAGSSLLQSIVSYQKKPPGEPVAGSLKPVHQLSPTAVCAFLVRRAAGAWPADSPNKIIRANYYSLTGFTRSCRVLLSSYSVSSGWVAAFISHLL